MVIEFRRQAIFTGVLQLLAGLGVLCYVLSYLLLSLLLICQHDNRLWVKLHEGLDALVGRLAPCIGVLNRLYDRQRD